MAMVFRCPPLPPDPDRLGDSRCTKLRDLLRAAGMELREGPASEAQLAELRSMYEPFVNSMAEYFLLPLPPLLPDKPAVDNWQTSAWMRRVPGLDRLPGVDGDEHFD
jgi:hypothetical protein